MVIEAPSGRKFGAEEINLIKKLGEIGFIKYSEKPFVLKSKVQSNVYVFGREELTSNPRVLWKVGQRICQLIRDVMRNTDDKRRPCFIGLPTAGTPLATAASLADYSMDITGRWANFYQMRSVRKQSHGVHESWVIGKPDPTTQRIFRVDNVVTDGGTKFEMAERMVEDGLPWDLDEIILVDRQQGALENMHKRGLTKIHVVWNLLDLTYVFGEVDVWPKAAVAQVEQEIKEHQLLHT